MLRDPYWDESLATFLDASNRYTHAEEEMRKQVGLIGYEEFLLMAAQVRELGVQAADAHYAMVKPTPNVSPKQTRTKMQLGGIHAL